MNGENKTKKYWIALNMISSITPEKIHILLDHFLNPKKIWAASRKKLESIPGFETSAKTFCQHRKAVDIEKELKEIKKRNIRVLTLEDEDYPNPLRSLASPPPVLYLKGDYSKEDEFSLAVVGTRRCTSYGKLTAQKLSKELARLGFTIVSGMALGVDTSAHRGALKAEGRTIAVLGSGFGHIYPRENLGLMGKIADSGCVFSEFSTDSHPARWTFPQRNRIISGLTRGTLVVEAPQRSGALITANLALEQGREVFAVPGNINNENSTGTHRLIKDGAKLVESIRDIIEEFPDLKTILDERPPTTKDKLKLSTQEEKVMQALSFEPIHIDEVIEKTGLEVSEISKIILRLQMKELIGEVRGKRYVKL